MKLTEVDMGKREIIRQPSPGQCIYCGSRDALTDEHVVPFALGANSVIFSNASCGSCAKIIQPYEQEVLKKQLGVFRAQVDAPTRNKKSRIKEVDVEFVEVDDKGGPIRNLGCRKLAVDDLPKTLNLWQMPEARILLADAVADDDPGLPWTYAELPVARNILRSVAAETGAKHVAMKLGEVNRNHFLRFLAKTAHAYAVMTLGCGTFRPFLTDLILSRSDDLARFVGGADRAVPHEVDPTHTTLLTLGVPDAGPAIGLIVVRLQFWHELNTPAYVVVVGEPFQPLDEIFTN